MEVLVLESEPGLADGVVEELTASGHGVARCHEKGQPSFPCKGMAGQGQCPLDAKPIDVAIALDGRFDGDASPPPEHDGARCALRRTIPLVVAAPKRTALAPYATKQVSTFQPGVVVTVAELAATEPLDAHVEAAKSAMDGVLEIHGLDTTNSSADVVRAHNELKVVLSPGIDDLSTRVREVASIRALAAIRRVDPHSARICVTVND